MMKQADRRAGKINPDELTEISRRVPAWNKANALNTKMV